jgi:DNA-binding CsgD family transcriptional regulator
LADKRIENDDPTLLVFCDRLTGVAQFRATLGVCESDLDHVAGLLAMQCLRRGLEPDDFIVLMPANKKIAHTLLSLVGELLEEGRNASQPATLSPRQEEVLHSVLRRRANKEIASELDIAVRTVKYHVSVLLTKFGVNNRTELANRVTTKSLS